MKKLQQLIILALLFFLPLEINAREVVSFERAKRLLESEVYIEDFMRYTIYSKAVFDSEKNITLPEDFINSKYKNRANRVEWEHVVPAQHFGVLFDEWNIGHPLCINSKGKRYKGRDCAEKASEEFGAMYTDLYNLFPSIGSVNAQRSNYHFVELEEYSVPFGENYLKVKGKLVEPPDHAKGMVARTYLYMGQNYDLYELSDDQEELMQKWNSLTPVTQEECIRTMRIEILQKNENAITKNLCIESGYWVEDKEYEQAIS